MEAIRKMMCNNPNVDIVNMNAYIKFGEILPICFHDFEWKQNYDGMMKWRNDGQPKSNIAPPFSKRGYNKRRSELEWGYFSYSKCSSGILWIYGWKLCFKAIIMPHPKITSDQFDDIPPQMTILIQLSPKCFHQIKTMNQRYWGQNFLLVDLREFFSDLGSGGRKKNKKALKMTS